MLWFGQPSPSCFFRSASPQLSSQPRTLSLLAVRRKKMVFHTLRPALCLSVSRQVHDGEVEYRDISIEGPKGIIRTSPPGPGVVTPPTPTPPPVVIVSEDMYPLPWFRQGLLRAARCGFSDIPLQHSACCIYDRQDRHLLRNGYIPTRFRFDRC